MQPRPVCCGLQSMHHLWTRSSSSQHTGLLCAPPASRKKYMNHTSHILPLNHLDYRFKLPDNVCNRQHIALEQTQFSVQLASATASKLTRYARTLWTTSMQREFEQEKKALHLSATCVHSCRHLPVLILADYPRNGACERSAKA